MPEIKGDKWTSIYSLCKNAIRADGRIKRNVEIDPRDVIELIDFFRRQNSIIDEGEVVHEQVASTCTEDET